MKKYISILAAAAVLMLSGCTSGSTPGSVVTEVSNASEVPETSAASQDAERTSEGAPEAPQGAGTPLTAADIRDGSYEITVDSSSTMFNITKCTLNVSNGKMTAVMTMHGKGYLYLFMGKGDDAVESGYIPFVEDPEGAHTFTVPVEALDVPVDCAAFSKKKEKWYDRELVFEASGIPADAFLNTSLKTVADLALTDGTYTAKVVLAGGSGRASVESPAVIEGKAEATIIWSSSNYDYVRVDEEKFLPVNTEGNSTFVIPVAGFDSPFTIYADTTAMSTPHEIEYTLTFDSSTLTEQK